MQLQRIETDRCTCQDVTYLFGWVRNWLLGNGLAELWVYFNFIICVCVSLTVRKRWQTFRQGCMTMQWQEGSWVCWEEMEHGKQNKQAQGLSGGGMDGPHFVKRDNMSAKALCHNMFVDCFAWTLLCVRESEPSSFTSRLKMTSHYWKCATRGAARHNHVLI